MRHKSGENWRWDWPNRPVKLVYLDKRDLDELKPTAKREMWKDRKTILMDAAGNSYQVDGFWLHKPPIKMKEGCIDITSDGVHFFSKHLMPNMDVRIKQINSQTWLIKSKPKAFTWKETLMKKIPMEQG